MDPRRGISSDARIKHMKQALNASQQMIVLLGEQYLSRLWCVYELSEFVLLHRDSLEGKLLVIGLDWPAWWNPLNWFREPTLSKAEKRMIARFSCRAARCERPADRQRILAEIRKSWGSEESFDAWMQDSMKEVLLWSKRE